MQTSIRRRLALTHFALGAALFATSLAFADTVVNTGIPGGDGKDLLNNPKDPDQVGGAILVRDEECAKKTMKGARLNSGKPNPAYEKCVKDKLEKAKKKGDQ